MPSKPQKEVKDLKEKEHKEVKEKEHKDNKEIKEKDLKEKEHKEVKEKEVKEKDKEVKEKDLKDVKDHKEVKEKDLKDALKEHKEVKEKDLYEGGPVQGPGPVEQPVTAADLGALKQRLDRLEKHVGLGEPFISTEERPAVGQSALSQPEPPTSDKKE